MKTIAIMQPYFFPYIGYWQLIHAVDRFIIYDDVNYINRGWVNRNRLLINGLANYMTVPLVGASQNKRICDIDLEQSSIWRNKLVKMVEITYKKAPFYKDIFFLIEGLIRYESDNLADYLANQLQTLAKFMKLETEFVLTSRVYENNHLTGQERILDICKIENATNYINPQGGQKLYDASLFSSKNLDLRFIIPNPIEYKQFGTLYVPWLSIVDVLMFNGVLGTNEILKNYSLVKGSK